MNQAKADLAREFFSQIESQVQFGDNKASLLIAGDAILLAIVGGLVRMVSGCGAGMLSVACVVVSPQLALAVTAAFLLVVSLACALWAATPARVWRVVARKGAIVSVGGPAGRWLAPVTRLLKAAVLSPFVSERVIPFISRNDGASLALLAELAEAGRIRTVVDRQFALSETPEAISYVGAGRARGKVVIKVR